MPTSGLRKLLSFLPHEDIGWKEIDETFVRYTLVKTPWFRIYLHNLIAVKEHPQCHSHPWCFATLILKGGYTENSGYGWVERTPGTLLFRPASWTHNVVTKPEGMWSLVVTGPKRHEWGFKECNG